MLRPGKQVQKEITRESLTAFAQFLDFFRGEDREVIRGGHRVLGKPGPIRFLLLRGNFHGLFAGNNIGGLISLRNRFEGNFQMSNFKNEGTKLNEIALAQGPIRGQQLTIDERAVAAAEVAQNSAIGVDTEGTMLPTNPIAIGTDVALPTSAKQIFSGGKNQFLAGRLSLNDEQSDIH